MRLRALHHGCYLGPARSEAMTPVFPCLEPGDSPEARGPRVKVAAIRVDDASTLDAASLPADPTPTPTMPRPRIHPNAPRPRGKAARATSSRRGPGIAACVAFVTVSTLAQVGRAATGDVLFSDDFESGLAKWTSTSSADVNTNTMTAASATRSLYLRGRPAAATSTAIDASGRPALRVQAWVRRGSDAFSENPESGEDLQIHYLDVGHRWQLLREIPGGGSPGEIFAVDSILSADALHVDFQLRISLTRASGGPPANSGLGWDYWHIDDVAVLEATAPLDLDLGRCEEFDAGLANWTVSGTTGAALTTSQAANSGASSLALYGGVASATMSQALDLSTATDLGVELWVRRGSDSFSEDPDRNEDLYLEYQQDDGDWDELAYWRGDGTPGQIYEPSLSLPAAAAHDGFRLRLRTTGDDGPPWDYWHVDSLCLSGTREAAHWAFEETAWTGATGEVEDTSGNRHAGIANGKASTRSAKPAIEGSPGTCRYARFDGVDDSITIPHDTRLNGTDALTYMAWIRPNAWKGVQQIIAKSVHGGGSGRAQMGLFAEHGVLRGRAETSRGRREVKTTLPATGDWTHVALVFAGDALSIVIDGKEAASSSFVATTLQSTTDPLMIGQRTGSSAYFFDGDLDDVRVYTQALSPAQIAGVMKDTAVCAVGFVTPHVTHDGSAQYCAAETVTVTMRNASGSVVSDYAGTIKLTTQTGEGTWRLRKGRGRFSPGGSDDGVAAYAFSTSDAGAASFALEYAGSAGALDIDVFADTERDNDKEGLLVFQPSAITLTATPLKDPVPSPVNDPIGTQVAGAAFELNLAAMGEGCGVAQGYDGPRNLSFWVDHDDPSTGTRTPVVDGNAIGASAAKAVEVPLTFTAGRASTKVRYADVGRIRIHASDATKTPAVSGSTNAFVVRPADLVVTLVRNGAGDANPGATTPEGVLFARAGDPLAVTVEARDASGERTPNFGRERTPEGVRISPASLVSPTGGALGTVGDPTALSSTEPAGTLTGSTLSWSEVGAVRLRATIADGDYLGTGEVEGTESDVVGRFAPSRFEITANTPRFATGCDLGAFTWMDQPFFFRSGEAPVLTVRAVNAAGQTTTNYAGEWWRITNDSLTGREYASGTGTLDPSGLPSSASDPAIADAGNGSGTLTFSAGSGLRLIRTNPVAPFEAEIALSIEVLDEDGTAPLTTPYMIGDTTPGSGIAFDVGKRFQFGRLALDNAHGSERVVLPSALRAQSFDGMRFVDEAGDNCSTVALSALIATPVPASLSSPATIANVPLLGGDAGLSFAAPGATGTLDVTIRLDAAGAALPWLRYDWPHDGSLDGLHDDDPQARITFGINAGREELIFLQEVY